jgi:hypothetical protein
MSPSGYFVKYNQERKRWCTTGKKIVYHHPRLFHPLKDEPIENKWIRTLTTYLFNQGWYEAEIGFRCTRLDTHTKNSYDFFRCHPSLYSQDNKCRPWFDFANCSFNMGGSIVEKYPVQIRLFGEVTDKVGRKKVFCVIQEFSNNEKTKKTSYQFLPFLQKDRLTKNLRVVEAETLESIFVLPCLFPANVDDCVDYIILPPQSTWDSIGWDECNFLIT